VYYARGEYDLAIEESKKYPGTDISMFLAQAGRLEEARKVVTEWRSLHLQNSLLGRWSNAILSAIDGDTALMSQILQEFTDFPDPEGHYYTGITIARFGLVDRGLDLLETAMGKGYANMPLFLRDPWADPIREHPRYRAMLAHADVQYQSARKRFAGRF